MAGSAVGVVRRFVFLTGAVAALDFVYGALFVVQPRSLGIDPASIGALFAVITGVGMVLEAPSGALADRWGHHRTAAMGLFLWGAGQALFGLANSLPAVVPALVLWAAGQSFFSGAPTSAVVNHLREIGREDDVAHALRRAQVSRWLSSGAGAAAVLAFGATFPASALLAVSGALILPLAVMVFRSFPSTSGSPHQSVAASLKAALLYVRTHRLAACIMISAGQGMAMGALILGWQPILLDSELAEPQLLGIALLLFTAACAVGAWANRYAPKNAPLAWAAIAVLLLTVSLWTAGSTNALAWPGLVLAEFFLGLAGTSVYIWQQSLFSDELRNTLFSVMATVSGIAVATGDFLFGHLWNTIGAAGAVQAVALCAAAVTTLGWLTGAGRTTTQPAAPGA